MGIRVGWRRLRLRAKVQDVSGPAQACAMCVHCRATTRGRSAGQLRGSARRRPVKCAPTPAKHTIGLLPSRMATTRQ